MTDGGTNRWKAPRRGAVDLQWTLLAGFLVFFMQVGFAMLETGMVRAKNVTHTMAMNVVVFCAGALGFWLCGYALQTGDWQHLCLSGRDVTPVVLALFLFHLMYMDTAATIPTGAMAERWRFLPFVLFALFMSTVIYPVYANWVWYGGWLSRLGVTCGLGHGHVDFAGSSVVHMTGGAAALAGAWLIGPRLGKFRADGRANPLPAHNVPMYMTGTLILTFGWFGFNTGAALRDGDPIVARVAVNTILACAAGAFASMTYTWTLYKKPDASFLCNGALAGLVAITAGCAYVAPAAAVFIGAIAGILVIGSCLFVERRLKIDDPVGAISVHGVSGAWGVLALGLFANNTHGDGLNGVAGNVAGLFYGNPGQLAAEVIGLAASLLWVLPVTLIFLLVVRRFVGLRVIPMVELQGLDVPELGTLGYLIEDAQSPENRYRAIDPRRQPAAGPGQVVHDPRGRHRPGADAKNLVGPLPDRRQAGRGRVQECLSVHDDRARQPVSFPRGRPGDDAREPGTAVPGGGMGKPHQGERGGGVMGAAAASAEL